MKTIVLLSGGLDSTTLLYLARGAGEVEAVSFDYGQRHAEELGRAVEICRRAGIAHWQGEMNAHFFRKGSLSGSDPIPEGHYAAENMASTIVPNRNAVMLSQAWALAITRGAQRVGYAAHSGDHPIYPDCRPEFMAAFAEAMRLGNDEEIQLWAPFATTTKAGIVMLGATLGVPFELTWSCYQGRPPKHCGRCGTCVERKEAFREAEIPDPTQYEDADYMIRAFR